MAGYSIALSEKFRSLHFFEEKKNTPESIAHPHDYCVEIQLYGEELDASGYLIDLEEIDLLLKEVLSGYSDVLLNDLPEFSHSPPSLERFARILCQSFSNRLKGAQIKAVSVKLWENERAWASFQEERK